MTIPHKWRKTVTVAGFIVLATVLVSVILVLTVPQVLLVRDAQTGWVYAAILCPNGTEFSVDFTHSVNLTPVIDTFRAQEGKIRAVKSRFYSFGAGMPTSLNPGEEFSFLEEGGMEITGMSMTYNRLSYIVGTVYDHYLYIQDKTFNLRELCGKNAHVELLLVGGYMPWH